MSPDQPTPADAPRPAARSDVDRAALLGAALAATVALTFGGEGEWDWLAAGVGVALLAVLGAFFRLPHTPRPAGALAEIAAMSAVSALAASLVAAAPLQAVLSERTAEGRGCRAAAAVAAAVVQLDERHQQGAQHAAERLAGEGRPSTPVEVHALAAEHQHRTVLGACLGAATSRVLWLPALIFGLAVFAGAWWRLRRTPHSRASASESSTQRAPAWRAPRRRPD
jgi:hypothetical protein